MAHNAIDQHAAETHAHPGPGDYIKVAAILAVITLIEVGIYYIDVLRLSDFFVPVLLALSAFKFGMVVLWFMHLRFDNRLFSIMFFGGLVLAGLVLTVLLFLFFFAGNMAGRTPPVA